MKFYKDIDKSVAFIKSRIRSEDVFYHEIKAGEKRAVVIYIDSITDKKSLGQMLINPLTKGEMKTLDDVKKCSFAAACVSEPNPLKAMEELVKGKCVLLFEGENAALCFDFVHFETRAISEPPTSTVMKGPREGFNESLRVNLCLMYRRIKVSDFVVERFTLGRYSKTSVAVCYISSITDPKVVEEVKKRLKLIDIDGVPDSAYIGKMIVEHKTSLFKQVGNTEKPDILAQKMFEGRVGIIVDGSPLALTVPYMFVEDFQSSEDYFVNFYRANMERTVRVLSMLIAVFLPAVFVSAQLFHLQLIPLNFLLTIVNSIKGIPLSPSFEMFFTLLIFEILNEASIRMPKYVGMALSIVGALVLGDTAVKAGIVSTPTIMIMALSGICLYTVPELVESMSVLRLVYLVVAGAAGGYGIVLLTAFIIAYLCSLENFGVPFLAPYAPLIRPDLKDGLFMDFISKQTMRPAVLKTKNKRRLKIKDVKE